jgi:hypothetical protein
VSKVGRLASDVFEVTYDPRKLSPKAVAGAVEKLGFGQSFSKPIGVIARSKRVIVQSTTAALTHSVGGKGTVKVGVTLAKGVELGDAKIEITGPKGFSSDAVTLSGASADVKFTLDKKKAKAGSHSLKVTVSYNPTKKGKALGPMVLTYTLPLIVK